jgi:shikimate kinase
MNISLIGFMGTGKSEVGKLLSKKLGMKYISIDGLIIKKENKSIFEIFETMGEPYFRRIEKYTVKHVSKKDNLIIDTGGGVVLDSDNIIDLRANGIIISLKARQEVILKRLSDFEDRPLLKGDKKNKIIDLLKVRKKLYEQGNLIIDTSDISPNEVVEKIYQFIREYKFVKK